PPTRIVPHQFRKASSDGAGSAAYNAMAQPAAPRSFEQPPQERVLVELGALARAAAQQPPMREKASALEATAPRESASPLVTTAPLVVQSARRRAILAAGGLVLVLVVAVGILFALHQRATPPP